MRTFFAILLITSAMLSCTKQPTTEVVMESIDSLSLYWDHEIFGEGGRRLRFEFYGNVEFENSYELVFDYTVENKFISIILVDAIDKGKCGTFPTPDGLDSLCLPRGLVEIPDNLLPVGSYTITLNTSNFTANGSMVVGREKISLNFSSEQKVKTSVSDVYPIPKNILFGSVVYSGDENTEVANNFVKSLVASGLNRTSVSPFPYRHLRVDESGEPLNSSWGTNNYSIGLLFSMTKEFSEVVGIATTHFEQSNINIYLYSWKGDQARFSKIDGVNITYAD
jgi:hypothetical protein